MTTEMQKEKPPLWCRDTAPNIWTVGKGKYDDDCTQQEDSEQENDGLSQEDLMEVLALYMF